MKTCSSISSCDNLHTRVFTIHQHAILDCTACEQRYTQIDVDSAAHLSKIYSDAYFFEGKDGYPNYLEEREIIFSHGKRYAELLTRYMDTGKILDAGCAAGFFLEGFKSKGWECSGLEPNSTMVEYGKKELGLNIEVGNLESFESSQQFDVVTLIQVVGHFYDLEKALSNVHRLLKPGGMVLVESWNRGSLIAKLFGKSWHEYSPPSVIHWFTDQSLIEIFKVHDLEFIDNGFPKKQINLKHALSLVSDKTFGFPGKEKFVDLLSRTFGKMKLYYPPLDLKWYLFQKSS